tara:strand:- start:16419 stop:16595 length:177 start_codon:yes stop_codon:yes gene_type:complete
MHMSKFYNTKEDTEVEGIKIKKPVSITKEGDQKELGGPQGLEPTRYGDWERKGRCVDF